MNEVERLAYLDAMGVDSYTPRVILPGALPSVLDVIDNNETMELTETAQEVTSATVSGQDVLKQLQAEITSPKAPVAKTATVQKSASTQISVRFHWIIYQPISTMLLLLPSAHAEQNCMELLRKMMSAIDVNAPLVPMENFVWPPVSNNASHRSSSSLEDARETLHALLEGYHLKQKKQQQPLRQVLVFDENLGRALFDGITIADLEIRILPSLHLILTSSPEKVAELKRLAWQRLKDLKP